MCVYVWMYSRLDWVVYILADPSGLTGNKVSTFAGPSRLTGSGASNTAGPSGLTRKVVSTLLD